MAAGDDSPLLKLALADAEQEYRSARRKHASINSAHEGWAVLFEEFDELWDEVKKKQPSKEAMRAEAVQVAAMALAFMIEVCG